MAGKSFGEEVAGELAGKAVVWGPSFLGAAFLGPLGILLGLVASAAIVSEAISGGSYPPAPTKGDGSDQVR
jgi:hypothetical protein